MEQPTRHGRSGAANCALRRIAADARPSPPARPVGTGSWPRAVVPGAGCWRGAGGGGDGVGVMNGRRIFDASMGAVSLLFAIVVMVSEGFPHGGVAFAGSLAFFRLAARP